jgi:hypothetical protein
MQYNTGNDPGKEKRLGSAAYPYSLLRIVKKNEQRRYRCVARIILFIPLSIITFRMTELRHKRLHDCMVVEKNV